MHTATTATDRSPRPIPISYRFFGPTETATETEILNYASPLYKLTSPKSSIHFRNGVCFSINLHISSLRSPIEVGPQTDPFHILNHHSPAPNTAPSIIVSWLERNEGSLERTRFWEGPLERTWVRWSGRLSGRIGLSEQGGWRESTRFWMGLLERTGSSQDGLSESMVGSS